MADFLHFVLAPASDLPQGPTSWADLADAQARGLERAMALRIFACPTDWPGNLETLVEAGLAHSGGADPFGVSPQVQAGLQAPSAPGQRGLRCDALVPVLDAASLCLGIYGQPEPPVGGPPGAQADANPGPIHCLACLPLAEIENETCWFYPTENGRYLSWQSQRPRRFLPGRLPDGEA